MHYYGLEVAIGIPWLSYAAPKVKSCLHQSASTLVFGMRQECTSYIVFNQQSFAEIH